MPRANQYQEGGPRSKGLNNVLPWRWSMHFLKKLEPGELAPDFELPNANENSGGQTITLSDAMGDNGTVVFFT